MSEELSPIKRALLEQRRLKARIEELERARSEPIAIIGMGCRFPGGVATPADLWSLLAEGRDAIGPLPADRWPLDECYDANPDAPGKIATKSGGFLRDIDQFDAHAFGISSREAVHMDPQQRLLLEVSWEALENAGHAPDTLMGSATGVFVGIGPNDYLTRLGRETAPKDLDAYVATGNANSVASGRLAYLLGTHGPALSVDTACSSSLTAVHLACQSLRGGACDMALAGGVSVILSLENFISLSKAHMMAPDGRCKAFDARADGFVRSEGCGVIVLKRLADAERDGDRILAVIRGSACNQDGRSNGLTAPNGPAQRAVIRAALADARVAPADVGYVEAHGTGTSLGDPIEMGALREALGEGRDAARTLRVGSLKSNVGHMEASAGIGGLIKCVLSLRARQIPASLHFRQPNPHIDWAAMPWLQVPGRLTEWRSDHGPRIAGVSAFGFSGTNVHVLLAEHEPRATTSAPGPHLLALSARSAAALRQSAAALARDLCVREVAIADYCASINLARSTLPYRVCFTVDRIEELRAALDAFASDTTRDVAAVPAAAPRVAFRLDATRVSSRDIEDARRSSPAFAACLDRLVGEAGIALVPGSAAEVLLALCASADVLRTWGLSADECFGRGVGALAAKVHARQLSPRDACAQVSDAPSALDAELRDAQAYIVDVSQLGMRGLKATLASAFAAGLRIDWRAVHRDGAAARTDVPASLFHRTRAWFGPATGVPDVVRTAAASEALRLPADADARHFTALWAELDALTTFAVSRCLESIGFASLTADDFTARELATALQCRPHYEILLERWLRRLVAAGLVREEGGRYRRLPGANRPARPVCVEVQRYPALVRYLDRCETNLPAMVTGRVSPLDVLFPSNSLEAGEFFYRDWSLARYFNGIVAAAAGAVAERASRPLRVLEIGAGTGGTTRSVLARLGARVAEYWFTDLSDFFFERAGELRERHPGMRFEIFDVDQDPAAQGIPTGEFDLVIAANSVHACRDLPRALANVRSLLATGGVLVLYEVTHELEWFDMSWGLVEGWQRHDDPWRKGSPLLSVPAWRDALARSGFGAADAFPVAGHEAEVLGHHVIVTQADPRFRVARAPVMSASDAREPRRAAREPAAAPAAGVLVEQLAGLTTLEKIRALETHVRGRVMEILRSGPDAPPPANGDRLMNLGVDSLMAVELRNTLARDLGAAHVLPGTLIYDYPTIGAIAGLLGDLLAPPVQASPPPVPAAVPLHPVAAAPEPEDPFAAIAALSEEDAGALLMQKLREVAS